LSTDKIYQLADLAAAAQVNIQRDFKEIDPVVGIMRSLRDSGFPADAMTIDCIVSGKRIIMILHDDRSDVVDYQFGYRDKDPDMAFKQLLFAEVNSEQIYNWIKSYFTNNE